MFANTMKPVMMAGEDTVPREGSYRQFFDNKRMAAFRYIIKPNFDSSIEPRKRDLTAAREAIALDARGWTYFIKSYILDHMSM